MHLCVAEIVVEKVGVGVGDGDEVGEVEVLADGDVLSEARVGGVLGPLSPPDELLLHPATARIERAARTRRLFTLLTLSTSRP